MPALVPSDYLRTRIIGFSVTLSWWSAFRAAIPNPSAWELRWYSGGSIDVWADNGHAAWTANNGASDPGGLVNPVGGSDNESAVDRVVLNVSGVSAALHPPGGYTRDVEEWRGYIEDTIANIRTRHPNVRMILLQPNIAGPADAQCSAGGASEAQPSNVIRSCYTSPFIRSAITSLTRGNVRGGYTPYAAACSDFDDWGGHLVTAAEEPIGEAVAAYYAANL